jgi:hypothetical protein
VTFANGVVARELIVSVDDDSRRLVYAVVGSAVATHHNASFEVIPTEDGCSLVWISDFLPDTAAGTLGAMIETGAGVMKRTLEAIK